MSPAALASLYTVYVWDIGEWLAELYAKQAAAAKRRKKKFADAVKRARVAFRMGFKLPSVESALSRALASVASAPGSSAAATQDDSSSDSEEFGDDVPTPRMVENFTKSPSPGLLVGHAYV